MAITSAALMAPPDAAEAVWGTQAEQSEYEEVEKLHRVSRRRSKRSRKRKTNQLYKQRMPAEVETMMGEANMQYASKQFAEAVNILKEVIRRSPNSSEPYEVMGLICQERSDAARVAGNLEKEVSESEKAATAFTIAADLKKTDAKLWYLAGKAKYNVGDYAQAAEFLAKAQHYSPNEIEYALHLAHLYSEQDKFLPAIKTLNKTFKLHKHNLEVAARLLHYHTNLPRSRQREQRGLLEISAVLETALFHHWQRRFPRYKPFKTQRSLAAAYVYFGQHKDEEQDEEDHTHSNKHSGPQIEQEKTRIEAINAFGNSDLHLVNRLCEHYLENERYDETIMLLQLVQSAFHTEFSQRQNRLATNKSNASSSSSLSSHPGGRWEMPLDLVIKFGIANLHTGKEDVAARCFVHLNNENDVDSFGDLFQDVAEAYAVRHKHGRAVQLYDKISTSEKYDTAEIWQARADSLVHIGRFDKACEDLAKLNQEYPADRDVARRLADALERSGKEGEAFLLREKYSLRRRMPKDFKKQRASRKLRKPSESSVPKELSVPKESIEPKVPENLAKSEQSAQLEESKGGDISHTSSGSKRSAESMVSSRPPKLVRRSSGPSAASRKRQQQRLLQQQRDHKLLTWIKSICPKNSVDLASSSVSAARVDGCDLSDAKMSLCVLIAVNIYPWQARFERMHFTAVREHQARRGTSDKSLFAKDPFLQRGNARIKIQDDAVLRECALEQCLESSEAYNDALKIENLETPNSIVLHAKALLGSSSDWSNNEIMEAKAAVTEAQNIFGVSTKLRNALLTEALLDASIRTMHSLLEQQNYLAALALGEWTALSLNISFTQESRIRVWFELMIIAAECAEALRDPSFACTGIVADCTRNMMKMISSHNEITMPSSIRNIIPITNAINRLLTVTGLGNSKTMSLKRSINRMADSTGEILKQEWSQRKAQGGDAGPLSIRSLGSLHFMKLRLSHAVNARYKLQLFSSKWEDLMEMYPDDWEIVYHTGVARLHRAMIKKKASTRSSSVVLAIACLKRYQELRLREYHLHGNELHGGKTRLTLKLLGHETWFNMGRAFHFLSVNHLAINCYIKAMAGNDAESIDDVLCMPQELCESSEVYDLQRQTAHNLVLLLKKSADPHVQKQAGCLIRAFLTLR